MKGFFEKDFLLISHRGASHYEPENTLRSFRRALEMGSSAIEFDVRKSRDGRLVVIHDSKVDRTTDGTGAVSGKTLDELKTLDAGFGERIPTLEEVFENFGGRCGLVVELKEKGTEEETVSLIKKHSLTKEVAVVSFRGDCIHSVRALDSAIPTGLITVFGFGCVKKALSLGCRVVATNHRFMTHRLVSEARENGLFVCCWTVNDPKRGEKLAGMGLDGVITDKPDLL